MKVYAHFYEVGNMALRWRTLLQFGDSWQLAGSVVMKNPGSAYPLTLNQPVNDMFVAPELQSIDNTAEWFEFKPDITMSCIARLFAEYAIANGNKQLNGIVQIFNLFNIREADLNKALQLYNGSIGTEESAHTTILSKAVGSLISTTEQDIIQFSSAPVYLGWGPLGNDERFHKKARQIFDVVKKTNHYLNDNYDDNSFFHPLYLMQYGAKKTVVQEVKFNFLNNT